MIFILKKNIQYICTGWFTLKYMNILVISSI